MPFTFERAAKKTEREREKNIPSNLEGLRFLLAGERRVQAGGFLIFYERSWVSRR